jgi:hypothetical protein
LQRLAIDVALPRRGLLLRPFLHEGIVPDGGNNGKGRSGAHLQACFPWRSRAPSHGSWDHLYPNKTRLWLICTRQWTENPE